MKTSPTGSHGNSLEARALSPGRVHNHVRLERTVSPVRRVLSPDRKPEGLRSKNLEGRYNCKNLNGIYLIIFITNHEID